MWRRGFLEYAHDLRQRPIFRAEWDAWGHCLTAATPNPARSEI